MITTSVNGESYVKRCYITIICDTYIWSLYFCHLQSWARTIPTRRIRPPAFFGGPAHNTQQPMQRRGSAVSLHACLVTSGQPEVAILNHKRTKILK